jgi:hypothetical protein
LASNESFRSYFLRENQEDIFFGETVITRHPEKHLEIEEAFKVLSLLSFNKNNSSAQFRRSEFRRLINSITDSTDPGKGFLRPDHPSKASGNQSILNLKTNYE